jgi:hypothetical protein
MTAALTVAAVQIQNECLWTVEKTPQTLISSGFCTSFYERCALPPSLSLPPSLPPSPSPRPPGANGGNRPGRVDQGRKGPTPSLQILNPKTMPVILCLSVSRPARSARGVLRGGLRSAAANSIAAASSRLRACVHVPLAPNVHAVHVRRAHLAREVHARSGTKREVL